MELVARSPLGAWAHARRLASRIDPPAASAWALAFVLVFYLALKNGGYDTVVRSEAGIAVWWIVLLGALAGILPTRIGPAAWIPIGLLAAFALWTGLAVGWSESPGASVVELGRVAAYLGVLVLGIMLQGRTAARHTVNGLASAIGLVTVLAVLARLHPQAFPANQQFEFLGSTSVRRLSYPLNYWNGLAAFAAMGVPLLLTVAIGARTTAAQAAATAILPLSALCIDMTVSRGGVLELGVGVTAFFVLAPRRLQALASLGVGGAGAGILVLAASRRSALETGIATPAALHQGTQLLWIAVIVCGGVAFLQAALTLAARNLEPPVILAPSRATTARRALALLAVGAVVAVAAGAPSAISRAWNDFKQPTGVIVPKHSTTVFDRLAAVNGNGRYQYWLAAVHAMDTDPMRGIGPGTFQFWWAEHATTSGFVRNAHSLYFETLAETGITGLVLLGGTLAWFLATAVRRALRAPSDLRLWLAGASAAMTTFLVAAAIDWVWQLATIAAAALLLGAVIVAGRDDGGPPTPAVPPRRRRASGAVVALLAVAALGAILVPLAEALAIRQSQAAAAAGNLPAALSDSLAAERLEPYSATPHLQEALVFEAAGELTRAAAQARIATIDAPTDWTTWLTLARIEARRGDDRAALTELARARALNPRSNLFQQT